MAYNQDVGLDNGMDEQESGSVAVVGVDAHFTVNHVGYKTAYMQSESRSL